MHRFGSIRLVRLASRNLDSRQSDRQNMLRSRHSELNSLHRTSCRYPFELPLFAVRFAFVSCAVAYYCHSVLSSVPAFDKSIIARGSNSRKEYHRTQSGLICSSCVRVGEVNRDLGERGSEWDGGMESKLLTKSK